ncbi:unnamed protein product [Caenorhabditis sp. 36 PRJEB53466]|nr:unnamed protein product [Caenorhabditis sp. 36 PRJEB53466]
MRSSAFKPPAQVPNSEDASTAPTQPKPSKGLKRMDGTARLNTLMNNIDESGESSLSSSQLAHSSSMVNMPSFPNLTPAGESTDIVPRSFLTRTNTRVQPLNSDSVPARNLPDRLLEQERKVTPLRLKVERTPGGTVAKASLIPKVSKKESPKREAQAGETAPNMRRTSSGSMLLRQTPERKRKQDGEIGLSRSERRASAPRKTVQRSGSLSKLNPDEEEPRESTSTLKRKRHVSCTSPTMPTLTPQKNGPGPYCEAFKSPSKASARKLQISPVKKRGRPASNSQPSSPMKKRCTPTMPMQNREENPVPIDGTPLRRNKSTINTKQLSERLALTYGTGSSRSSETNESSSHKPAPPKLATRSTSGAEYYSANEGDEPTKDPTVPPETETTEVFFTSSNSLQKGKEMVPLVKKQMSIDDKVLEDEEDEGFGDSTKTIKRGQGGALARSLSLKLSTRRDQQKTIGADTEKSCSTPSLPTAPLIRQASTSSLRFKVSPSTFLREPVSSTPVATTTVTVAMTRKELSEPSTSKRPEPSAPTQRKSSLKTETPKFVVREDQTEARRRKIRYDGLKVFYFDRRQGDMTVPSEGEVALGMHNDHHTHRFFPLNSGKRPNLDLSLYDDEELEEDEVITPDSDGEKEYEEFQTTKSLPLFKGRARIKMLKKSGVKVERNTDSMESIRRMREECGCSCKGGKCLPETCQCALDGLMCQIDNAEAPHNPCSCYQETCQNPEGRLFFDAKAVANHRNQVLTNFKISQRTGIIGSPVVTKFPDSPEGTEDNKMEKAKQEKSPKKYPVTPVYTRRTHSSLSAIRESTSEVSTAATSSLSLSDRMQHLENEVCVEAKKEEDTEKEENSVNTVDAGVEDVFPQEEYVATDADVVEAENDLLEAAMSPVQATLVV